MTSWPSNWKDRTLAAANIPSSLAALKILSAWRQSTPLDPWTNNPLGMPAKLVRAAAVPGTPYAMFRSMTDFYTAITQLARTTSFNAVVLEMTHPAAYGPAWRAISALGWPGSATESDYPAKVLDLAGEAYAASAGAVPAASRKSAGRPRAPQAVHDAMTAQANAVVHAAAAFKDATAATRYLIERHARYGK